MEEYFSQCSGLLAVSNLVAYDAAAQRYVCWSYTYHHPSVRLQLGKYGPSWEFRRERNHFPAEFHFQGGRINEKKSSLSPHEVSWLLIFNWRIGISETGQIMATFKRLPWFRQIDLRKQLGTRFELLIKYFPLYVPDKQQMWKLVVNNSGDYLSITRIIIGEGILQTNW
jgi:hypothetical protein